MYSLAGLKIRGLISDAHQHRLLLTEAVSKRLLIKMRLTEMTEYNTNMFCYVFQSNVASR